MSNTSTVLANERYSQLLGLITKEIARTTEDLALRKAASYWKIGGLINKHFLNSKGKSDFGSGLYRRLCDDTGIDVRTLQQMTKFNREFPRPQAGTPFNWSAYRKFLGVKDASLRQRLIHKAQKKRLSARRIAEEIKAAKPFGGTIEPKRGTPYTYRISSSALFGEESNDAVIDCGFSILRRVPAEPEVEAFGKGTIVESASLEDRFRVRSSSRTSADLYTYRASLIRVVDGDTVVLDIDLGFRTSTVRPLRLRGLDTPEADTARGKRASAFLQEKLHSTKKIVISTRGRDMYDRYLTDIFIGAEGRYLNQMLLDEKLATMYS